MAASKRSLLYRPKKGANTTIHSRPNKRGARLPQFYLDSRQGINWYTYCTRGADSQLFRRTHGSWSHTMMKVEPPQTPKGFKRLAWVDVIIQPTDSPDEPAPYTYTEVGDGDDFLEEPTLESKPRPPKRSKQQTQAPAVTETEEGPDELEVMSAQGMLLPRAYPPRTWGCQPGTGVAYNCCGCQVVTYKEWGLAKCVICGHLVCETCTEI